MGRRKKKKNNQREYQRHDFSKKSVQDNEYETNEASNANIPSIETSYSKWARWGLINKFTILIAICAFLVIFGVIFISPLGTAVVSIICATMYYFAYHIHQNVVLQCAVCGISESRVHLKLCDKCQMVAYCGQDCQLEHWRNGNHCAVCPGEEGFRGRCSDAIAQIASIYPQFQGDPRFQQLEQDLENGDKRSWLRHALELLLFLAEARNEEGQYYLGTFYRNGFGVKQDVVKWYLKASNLGNADAQCNLGMCYAEGEGVPKDMTKAAKWYQKAAYQGDAKAQYNFGACYYKGEGIPKNPSEAVKWWQKAADQGLVEAEFNLGLCYEKGEGVPKNPSEAMKWFRKAADEGYAIAQHKVGFGYYFGEGVSKSMIEAAKWYRKAADQGYASAQSNLGSCYRLGEGVPKDVNKALNWWRKAADQGNAYAQCNLGACYGNGEGVPMNLSEARRWYRKAADQGHAEAFEALKILTYHQLLEQKMKKETVSAVLQCAVCGISESRVHLKLCANCQMVAYCAEDCQLEHWKNGDHRSVCPKAENMREYISSHFAILASKNSIYPQFHGDSRFQQLEQDLKNGAKRRWLRHALDLSVFLAEANIQYGQFHLGSFYQNGFGVMQDAEEAVKWYRKAADQGHFGAQFSLGACYHNGEGVPKNMSEAAKWYQKAADQGNTEAIEALKILDKNIVL